MKRNDPWVRGAWISIVGGVFTLLAKEEIASFFGIEDPTSIETAGIFALLFGLYRLIGYKLK